MKIPWRGAAVVAAWILWPPAFVVAYVLLSFVLATGRGCSIEGCDPPGGWLGVLWFAAIVGPPIVLTIQWVRWRRA
jgi:hypothetical protein